MNRYSKSTIDEGASKVDTTVKFSLCISLSAGGQDPQRQSQGYGQPSQPYNQHPQPPPVPAQQQTNVLFNDTSGTPSQPPPSSQFPMGAGNLFSDPMVTSAAMQVGTDFAKEAVEKNVSCE